MDKQLPPLPDEAFDGQRFEAPIHKTKPLPKRCTHKGKATLVSSTELKCECGSGWSGPNIHQLYTLLK